MRYPFHPATDPCPNNTDAEMTTLKQRLTDEYPNIDQPVHPINLAFGAGKNPDLTDQIPARYYGRKDGESFNRRDSPTFPPALVKIAETMILGVGPYNADDVRMLCRTGIDGAESFKHFAAQAISHAYPHQVKTALCVWILDSMACMIWIDGHLPPYIDMTDEPDAGEG